MITLQQLMSLVSERAQARVPLFIHSINDTTRAFKIDESKYREAAFLATILHESQEFLYTAEIASGKAYEDRADLGDTNPGDGVRFKGRGLIQITGRTNYAQCGADLGVPIVTNPSLLEEPELAARSAGWFWDFRGLNGLADQKQFGKICQRVNGGWNGIDSRIEYFVRCRMVLENV